MIGSAMMAWGKSADERLASAQWLGRAALVERLTSATEGGGTVVIAAEPGTGKTTLLRQWLGARSHNGAHMADLTTAAGFDAAVAQLAGGATVVVDQTDRLDRDRLAALGAADRGPGSAVVVSGRTDPLLAGATLQLSGEDLAWSRAEVVAALHRWGRPISDGQADEIAWISEGWCAAVRLAAVAGPAVLREESAALHQQLMQDAAAAASPDLLSAAIELSAVDQFDAGTVDAILDPPAGGAAVLDELLRHRLFLRPTGEPGVWRFHRLFLQAARRELRSRSSAAMARWPDRATRDPVSVSRRFLQPHARYSNLTDDMLESDLLAAHAVELLLQGVLEPPSPAALMRAARGTALGRAAIALAALAAGDVGAAEFADADLDEPRDTVSGGLAMVTALLRARRTGALPAAVDAAQGLASTASDDGRRALAWLELGTLEADFGHHNVGEAHLELAASLADHARRPALAARAWAALAVLSASQGRLRITEQRLGMIDEDAALPVEALVRRSLARATTAFLRDDLERAAADVDAARQAAAGSWDPVLALYVLITEIAVLEARGNDALATARLAEADEVRARCPEGLHQVATLELYRARLMERAGREQEAQDVLGAIEPSADPGLSLAGARREMQADDPAAALAVLQAGRFPDGRNSWQLLSYAVAVDRLGDDLAAHEALEQALGLAEAEGLRRAFVEEGIPARALLEAHLRGTTAHAAFIADLLDHIDAHRPAPDAQLRSRLTDRELVVLGYLPSEMTAGDIANALSVSETTVRTHLHHIYEKLDADGRRDAVRRARELRLLSPQ
jgi:LuxR family transcriptional regulator, maltose regulon positive regulatory protein